MGENGSLMLLMWHYPTCT